MRTKLCLAGWCLLFGYAVSVQAAGAQTVTEIVSLHEPRSITVDSAGHVYVLGSRSDLFKITPRGEVAWRRFLSDWIDDPQGLAVDADGVAYVSGSESDNVIRIESDSIREVLDATGDGIDSLRGPRNIAVSATGHVYVVGSRSDNAFEIAPDGTVTQIIDRTGDGTSALDYPLDLAVDASGTVYVTGSLSNNAFSIRPDSTITRIIDESGDGVNALIDPRGIGVDASGTVYVAGVRTNNAFSISPDGTIMQIIDESGDSAEFFRRPWDLAVEPSGFVHIAGFITDNVFTIRPDGTITRLIGESDDGAQVLNGPSVLAASSSGLVYVGGYYSDNALALSPYPGLSDGGGLLVPGFEAAIAANGSTTLFAVRNPTDEPVTAVVEYLGTTDVEPLRTESVELASRATVTRNIGTDPSNLEIEDGVARGLVRITEPGDLDAASLTGDFFRVDPVQGFATGGRLIRPAEFCRQQEVRFVDFGDGATLSVLVDRPRGAEVPSFSYTAYDEAGIEVASGVHFTSRYQSKLDVGELAGGAGFGTLRFDFTNAGFGWVSAAYSAFGRFSAEIEGTCGIDGRPRAGRTDAGITQILGEEGDGEATLERPGVVAGDALGNIYVTGESSDNVFKISRNGLITEIIDESGGPAIYHDGFSKSHYGDDTRLRGAGGLAVSPSGYAYVTSRGNGNVFEIAPDGTITRIMDGSGDGIHALELPTAVAVSETGSVYVVGTFSDNVFEILPDGTITQILDASGDGVHTLNYPEGIAVSASGNVYVTGGFSDNVFEVTPDGVVTQILDATGDGVNALEDPVGIAVDPSGRVYVAGLHSDNVFEIQPDGTVTQILDATGNGTYPLNAPIAISSSSSGHLYVAGVSSDNVLEIAPDGEIFQVIDISGDGNHPLNGPFSLYTEASGNLYVVGYFSNNAFAIFPHGALTTTTQLVVPGFEFVTTESEGPTTLFALHNTADEPVCGVINYMGLGSFDPAVSEPFELGPRAVLTRNVDLELPAMDNGDGIEQGLVLIKTCDGSTPTPLVGDYFRVDATNDFATGGALVRPEEFCVRQEVRFVDFGAGSTIRVLANRPRGDEVPSFSFTTYDESGATIREGDVHVSDYVTTLDAEVFAGELRFGTVRFDFLASDGGWASVENSAFGEFSVEIEGLCLD